MPLVARHADLTLKAEDGQSASDDADEIVAAYLESMADKPINSQTLADADAAAATAASKRVHEAVVMANHDTTGHPHGEVQVHQEYMKDLTSLLSVPGVDLDYCAGPYGKTPLIAAVKLHDRRELGVLRFAPHCVEVVEALLNANANPNTEASGHGSPLGHAATMGHLDVVKALVKAGADPNAIHSGKTPLQRAQQGLKGTFDPTIHPKDQSDTAAVAYYLSEL